jgi:hypothetical protein
MWMSKIYLDDSRDCRTTLRVSRLLTYLFIPFSALGYVLWNAPKTAPGILELWGFTLQYIDQYLQHLPRQQVGRAPIEITHVWPSLNSAVNIIACCTNVV